jgi:4-diphosphocytidyl-2C-methyl-D-erythritol kinase
MKRSSLPLVVKSCAKLNLYLQVLNKRKDNFHNLNTLFARINLADTLIFRKRPDSLIKIKTDSPDVPKDAANLCYRAAALLKQESKLENYGLASNSQSHKLGLGVQIELKKCIPVGAGLGGGSSNAASVLLGLNKFWNLNLPKTRLLNLGAKLGSDVPFFIHQAKFALGSQRGDKVKPLISLNKLKLWFILVYPNFKVSTSLIYQKFDLSSRLTRPRGNVKILSSQLLKKGKAIDAGYFFNGLETTTSSLYPVINQVKNALSNMGLDKVMMSGSGSAVFAICDSCKQAQSLRNKLCKRHKSWQVFVVFTV